LKKLLIFDASNYMFRAYFASLRKNEAGEMVPMMTTRDGFPTNALQFFTSMLLSSLNRVKPDAIALAYDHPGKKFRHELFVEYKGNRPPIPDAFRAQIPIILQITEALGLKAFDAEGFEADDVIATLTQQAVKDGYQVIIGSPDKDLMQLIRKDGSVTLLSITNAMGKRVEKWLTYDDVIERFQVSPDKVADVLALSGDTCDNIPGCKGIGEKTAGQLISQFGSLEALMSRLDEIKKPAQHRNLEAFKEQSVLSKQLVSLVYDVPVKIEYGAMDVQRDKVVSLFTKYELRKLMKDLLGDTETIESQAAEIAVQAMAESPVAPESAVAPKSAAAPKASSYKKPAMPNCILHDTVEPPKRIREFVTPVQLTTPKEVENFATLAKQSKKISFWPVWSESYANKMVGLGIAVPGQAAYISFAAAQRSLFCCSNDSGLEAAAVALFNDPSYLKIAFGIKPFVRFALARGITFDVSSWFDAEIAAYVVHPEKAPMHFADVVKMYLGNVPEVDPDTWLGSGKKRVLPEAQPVALATAAVGSWAQMCDQLEERLERELDANALREPYTQLDLPLAPILAKMEFEGVKLDLEALRSLSAGYAQRMSEFESLASQYAGETFNLNSPKQVGELLYKKLGLVPGRKKKTASGNYSTDEETLETLSDQHPLPKVILDYRAIAKLKSTYADALSEQADQQTHRIHGRFNACVTATTRLSSSDPNLQNIPSRDEEGRRIKHAFVARDGWSFVSADYSQIELRLMAAYSLEPALCEAFRNGVDVHSRTAAALFDIPIEQVQKNQRQLGKTINFALLYGMGAQKLARETGYSTKEAKEFLDKFKAQFPTLSAWFDNQLANAKSRGEARTLLGHRRVMHELFDPHPMIRAAGDRIALNAPVQGGASDIVKKAMIRLDQALSASQLKAKLLIQVHDELLLECPDDEVDAVARLLRTSMEGAAELCVPLAVELKIAKTWA